MIPLRSAWQGHYETGSNKRTRRFVPPCQCSRRKLRLVRNSRSCPASLWLWGGYDYRLQRKLPVAGFAAAFISSRITSKRSWMDQFQEALAQTMNEPRRTYGSKMSWTQVKKILNFWKPWNSHLPTNRYGVFVKAKR